MSIWLCRAGRLGEHENKFLEDNKIYCTWDDLDVDLKKITAKPELCEYLRTAYAEEGKTNRIRNWTGQIWPFVHEMKVGDWIMLPSKIKPTIHIGRITTDYNYERKAVNPYFHSHGIEWFKKDVPRTYFEQDILYTLGASMTICRIKQEQRIKEIIESKDEDMSKALNLEENVEVKDIEIEALDNIKDLLIRKYKGHGMTRIIASILRAKGFLTYLSPEGPDKGVDILAAKGTLGFESPKICVQVKTSNGPVDRPTLDQLIGTMINFKAEYGLLASWNGFKNSVVSEMASQFFKVKLWTHNEIVREFLANYENLDDDIKMEVPLKKIWILGNVV